PTLPSLVSRFPPRRPPPPRSTLFPYTTLFRSWSEGGNYVAALLIATGSEALSRLQDQRDERVFVGSLEKHGLAREIAADVFGALDRKSTRLNSSHVSISYAVFCLKKKKTD